MPGYPGVPSVQTVTDTLASIAPAVGNVAGYYVWLFDPVSKKIYGPSSVTTSGGVWSIPLVPPGEFNVSYGQNPNNVFAATGDTYLVALNPPTKSMAVYNVKTDFGAVGDGVADDTIPIQNALNAINTAGGGICYFPVGTYKVTTNGVIVYSTTRVMGAGRGLSIIKQVGNLNPFNTGTPQPASTDVTFEKLTMDCTGATGGTGAIVAVSCTRLWVLDCYAFKMWSHGIFTSLCTDVVVANAEVSNCGDAQATAVNASPIILAGVNRATVTGCILRDSTRQYCHGVNAYSTGTTVAKNVTVTGNVFFNLGAAGTGGGGAVSFSSIVGYRATGCTVVSNVADTTSDSGIWINGDNAMCNGNMISNVTTGPGIEISDSRWVTAFGNVCHTYYSQGIWLHVAGPGQDTVGLLDITLESNVCDTSTNAAQGVGIYVNGDGANYIKRIAIVGNDCRNNQTDGIFTNSTGGMVTIVGNICTDNGVAGAGLGAGIRVYGGGGLYNCNDTMIEANVCIDSRVGGARTQDKGIWLQNSPDYVLVLNNDVRNNVTSPIVNAGLGNCVIRGNIGYNPQGTGTAITLTTTVAVPAVATDRVIYITNGAAALTAVVTGIAGNPSIVIPASGFAGIFVPAGQTLTPTFASGAPTAVGYYL